MKQLYSGLLIIYFCMISAVARSYTPMPIPDMDYTDLHRAADTCSTEKARAVLNALPANKKTKAIDQLDREGYTPLAYAAQKGCMEIVKLLVKANAAVDATDDHSRWTPLLRAATNQHAEVVDYLLKHHAAVDHKAGGLGQTPLTEAILGPYFGTDSQKGRGKTVRLLLAAGADVNAPGRSGWTPLITAVFRSDAGLVRLLIDKGADLLAKDEKGKTALDYAEERNEKKVAGILKDAMSSKSPAPTG